MTGRVYFESLETHVFDAQGRWLKSWFFCEGCGRAFETKREALECCSANGVVNDRYHVCMRCGSVFTTASAFEDHRARGCVKVVNEAKNTRELHACLSCGATLTSRAALESHLQWHESRAPETKIVLTQDGRVVGALSVTGNPRLRFVSEALIGEGQASCDRCGRVTSVDKIITIFTSTIGTKLDLCKACAREVVK